MHRHSDEILDNFKIGLVIAKNIRQLKSIYALNPIFMWIKRNDHSERKILDNLYMINWFYYTFVLL